MFIFALQKRRASIKGRGVVREGRRQLNAVLSNLGRTLPQPGKLRGSRPAFEPCSPGERVRGQWKGRGVFLAQRKPP